MYVITMTSHSNFAIFFACTKCNEWKNYEISIHSWMTIFAAYEASAPALKSTPFKVCYVIRTTKL